MSLATRCPACGTIFRVVQDQLKVSEGWVRCGQCHEVFHGIEHLFDLETDPTIAARRGAAPGGGADMDEDSAPGFAPTRTPPIGAVHHASAAAPSSPVPGPGPASAPAGGAPGPQRRFLPPRNVDAGPASAPAPFTASPPPGPFERTDVLPPTPAPGEQLTAKVEAPVASRGAVEVEVDVGFEASVPAPATAPRPASAPAPAASAPEPSPAADPEATTLPSRLAEDAGPETLASLLPEPPGEWPPRRKSSRRPKDKDKEKARSRAASTARDAGEGRAGRDEAKPAEPQEDHPRFLREARRAAFWNTPTMRAGLGLALVLLGLGAVGQVAWPLRDTLAARYPVTAPLWQALCEQAGCTLQAPRSLASLALEGSSLTRTETEHVLLFSADLRNKSPWPTRTPAFDLKFTDLGGQVVARRVFEPADLGLTQAALGPDGELHVRARLRLDGIDAVGFQAELFYP